jgi:hypothetical protein
MTVSLVSTPVNSRMSRLPESSGRSVAPYSSEDYGLRVQTALAKNLMNVGNRDVTLRQEGRAEGMLEGLLRCGAAAHFRLSNADNRGLFTTTPEGAHRLARAAYLDVSMRLGSTVHDLEQILPMDTFETSSYMRPKTPSYSERPSVEESRAARALMSGPPPLYSSDTSGVHVPSLENLASAPEYSASPGEGEKTVQGGRFLGVELTERSSWLHGPAD